MIDAVSTPHLSPIAGTFCIPHIKNGSAFFKKNMTDSQSNNPLHGITLEQILLNLVEHYGWEELGRRIDIRCFNSDPSLKSSLKFLRKTDWARKKVEELYIDLRGSNQE